VVDYADGRVEDTATLLKALRARQGPPDPPRATDYPTSRTPCKTTAIHTGSTNIALPDAAGVYPAHHPRPHHHSGTHTGAPRGIRWTALE